MKIKILALFLLIFWLVSIYLVVFSNISNNSHLSISKVNSLDIKMLIPQGWGFFTRNPRSLSYQLYRKENDKLIKVLHPNFHSTNSFGLSRRNRSIQAQILTLLKSEKINWDTSISNQFEIEPISEQHSKTIHNSFDTPLLCGEYILEASYPIPLEYSKYTDRKKSKKVYLNIICD